jgi:hypothetical protein
LRFVVAAIYTSVALLIVVGSALAARQMLLPLQKGRIAVISDTFTAAAYRRGAFYDYYCSHKPAASNSNNKNSSSSSVSSISSSNGSNNSNGGSSIGSSIGSNSSTSSTTTTTTKPDRFCQRHNVKCGLECITIRVNDDPASRNATPDTLEAIQKYLGNFSSRVDVITDGKVSTNPTILNDYDKVIVLHNEYVTQTEYSAIIHHKKVVYLYPNALYAEVKFDPVHSTITLIRGHGYPVTTIANGFGWKHDNTREEYDRDCNNWAFHNLDEDYDNNSNTKAIQLNCYPEYDTSDDTPILEDVKFWKVVREY